MRFRRAAPQATPTAADALRPLLLGDVPLGEWPPPGQTATGEPWSSFASARAAVAAGRTDEAVATWRRVAADPSLEARQTLQAWTFLRAHGVAPDEAEGGRVLGVVCEVAVDRGHDVLAAYRDGSARYLNHSGAVVVAEGGPAGAAKAAQAVVAAASPLGAVIGVWEQPALPPLGRGVGRVLLLTPGGLRFGQGRQADLWKEPSLAPVLDAATQLMALLTRAAR